LLIAATTEIGALAAGAKNAERQALRIYGTNLGCAFQIVDDLLDYLGDQNTTGKQVGNDLAEGKMTLPLILAMNRAGPEDRQHLLEILQSVGLRREGFKEVTGLIVKYNGFTDTRLKAEALISDAISQLEIFPDAGQRKDRMILAGLAQYVLTRKK
jgi:octaprenyl-diphosphate synthase